MVKTRTNSPIIRTLRSGNGRGKNIGNIEEKVSSDGAIIAVVGQKICRPRLVCSQVRCTLIDPDTRKLFS